MNALTIQISDGAIILSARSTFMRMRTIGIDKQHEPAGKVGALNRTRRDAAPS
jgi:hypothetical protein